MTALDTHLALDAERRSARYEPESFLLIDVARILSDDHAPRGGGVQCACEDQPDGGSWTDDQTTWAEHVTAELAKAGHLRDDAPVRDLLSQIARLNGQLEQARQSLDIAAGRRLPFHPQEQS